MRLKLLTDAKKDIGEAISHLKKTDPDAIDGLLTAINKSLSLILANPNVGRPVSGKMMRLWSIPNWPYVIPYRIRNESIEVLRVWHTRRDRPETW